MVLMWRSTLVLLLNAWILLGFVVSFQRQRWSRHSRHTYPSTAAFYPPPPPRHPSRELHMDVSESYYDGFPSRVADAPVRPDGDQLEAITCQYPAVMIVAGPGSGKTRVMASRLAHLLRTGTCQPSEILLISFTKDAAENLRHTAEEKMRGSVATARGLACFTFHGFCESVLRKHGHLLFPTRKEWFLADEGDQIKMLKDLMEIKSMSPSDSFAKNVLNRIRFWKENGLGYLGVRKKMLVDHTDQRAYDLYPEYQSRLKSLTALDLGDLLLQTLRIFRAYPAVLAEYRQTYKHILVDEFQDVSPAQYDILRLLVLGNSQADPDKGTGAGAVGNRNVGVSGGPIVGDDGAYESGAGAVGTSPVDMGVGAAAELSPAQRLAIRRNRLSPGAATGAGATSTERDEASASASANTAAGSSSSGSGGIPRFFRLRSPYTAPPPAPVGSGATGEGSGDAAAAAPDDAPVQHVVNVFCAGDDDQSIYEWRGAKAELMRRFQYDFPGSRVVKFCVSYRLPDDLCRAANSLMASVPHRIPKSLHSPAYAGFLKASRDVNTDGTMLPASFLPTTDESAEPTAYRDVQAQAQGVDLTTTRAAIEIRSMPSEVDEINWVVEYIQKKNESSAMAGRLEGYGNRASVDIAILTRSQDGLRRVVDALRKVNIVPRARNIGSRVLPPTGTPPLNLLRLLAHGDDDIAFESALDNDDIQSTCEKAEIEEHVLPVIRSFVAEHDGFSMLEATRQCVIRGLLPSKYSNAMHKFILFVDTWRTEFDRYWGNRERENLERRRQLVYKVLSSAYYQRWHQEFADQVDDLSKSIAPFDSLRQFFAALGYGGDFVVETNTLGRMLPDVPEALKSDTDTGSAPSSRAVGVEVKVWAMVMHAAKGLEFDEVMLPFWNEGVVPPQRGIPPIEERKLAFVSLTRARERVLISYGKGRKPSPLVEELLSLPEPPAVVFEDVPTTFFNKLNTASVDATAGSTPSRGGRKSVTGAHGRGPITPPQVTIMGSIHRDLNWELFQPPTPPPPATAAAAAAAAAATAAEVPAKASEKKKKPRKASGPQVAMALEQLTLTPSEIARLLADPTLSRTQLKELFKGRLDRLGVKKGTIPVVAEDGSADKRALSKCTAEQLGAHLATLLGQQQQ